MLDPKKIRRELQDIADNLKRRHYELDQAAFTQLETQRHQCQSDLQALQIERKQLEQAFALAKRAAATDPTEPASCTMDSQHKKLLALNETITRTEATRDDIEQRIQALSEQIPNLLDSSVPDGTHEDDNVEVRTWGEPKVFDFPVKSHFELAPTDIDFATASKLAGARFAVLRGDIARLNRALAQFMLDVHIKEHGYQEVNIPYIANRETLFGTGQLPKFEADLFALQGEREHFLIPTAEVSVTNFVRDEIVSEQDLPMQYVCHSACFRSEAGSYGRDTRGLIRQHQFEKVELVHIVKPTESDKTLEVLTQHAERILQYLQLPYRVLILCAGDTGFAAAKTYDIEVWVPSQQKYREISSCSNTRDFQARRMRARWRNPASGKPELLHTLNGSGLAIGRTLLAVLENYQQADGSILLPDAIVPYMDGRTHINPRT